MENVKTFIPEIHPEIRRLIASGEFSLNRYDLAMQGHDPDHMRTQAWADRIKTAIKAGRFEMAGGFQVIPAELAGLPADTEVVRRQGESDSIMSAGELLAEIREIAERQAQGRFEADEVAHILTEVTGEHDIYSRLHKAFNSGRLKFWRGGLPVDPEANDMPLSYGEYTTRDAVNNWLEVIGAKCKFPTGQSAQAGDSALHGETGGWNLIKPKRSDALTPMIYNALKAMERDGDALPRARDVMDAIQRENPADFVELTAYELKYYDANGEVKSATTDNIKVRLDRMTGRKAGR